MKNTNELNNNQKPTIWKMEILVLCIYTLIALAVETFVNLTEDTKELVNYIDTFVCCIFLVDFSTTLYQSKKKARYFFTWGWIDLLSSIPNLQAFRWGRATRIVKIFRIFRAVRSTRALVAVLFKHRAKGTLAIVGTICLLLIFCSSIIILNCETTPNSNIKTATDALWWSFVTISTVGYGEYYPVTTMGRVVAVFLIIAGIGLFSTFTAYIAAIFMDPKEEQKREIELLQEITELKEMVRNIEKGLNKKSS
jgi:voltage-gated potassium channel